MKAKVSRFLKIGLPVLLVLGLIAGLGAPSLADARPEKPSLPPNTIKGKVTAVAADKTSFDVKPGAGDVVTVKVNDKTKYFILKRPLPKPVPLGPSSLSPRKVEPKPAPQNARPLDKKGLGNAAAGSVDSWHRFGKEGTFDDIAVGDRVIVKLHPNENLAKEVLIIKAPKVTVKRVRGQITAVSQGSITIDPEPGDPVVLKWDENTQFILKGLLSVEVGQTAVAVYNTETMLAKTVHIPAPPAPTTASN